MSKQKYLILGGNGLIGKNLAKVLRANEAEFAMTSRDPEGLDNAIRCDILDEAALAEVFEKTQPDVVINATNLAGGVDFCEHNPDKSEAFHLNANINIGNLDIDEISRTWPAKVNPLILSITSFMTIKSNTWFCLLSMSNAVTADRHAVNSTFTLSH